MRGGGGEVGECTHSVQLVWCSGVVLVHTEEDEPATISQSVQLNPPVSADSVRPRHSVILI